MKEYDHVTYTLHATSTNDVSADRPPLTDIEKSKLDIIHNIEKLSEKVKVYNPLTWKYLYRMIKLKDSLSNHEKIYPELYI